MERLTLFHKDGFTSTTPWLRSQVRLLQKALNHRGAELEVDGYYGDGSVKAVENLQQANGMEITGTADAAVWKALEPHIEAVVGEINQMIAFLMPGFRGDLEWVHLLEGHLGKSYWPGGNSGVTLDPGVDLGHVEFDQVKKLFGGAISDFQYEAIRQCKNVFGENAKALLKSNVVLQGIRISRKKANEVMPFASKPYWRNIVNRFPVLGEDSAHPAVQTIMLSLSYNRGPGNRDLEQLAEPLNQQNWAEVANLVGNMQQDHRLEGIRKRRFWEGMLVKTHLERMPQ